MENVERLIEKLGCLEEKVIQAIQKIELLKNENLRLSEALATSESQVQKFKDDHQAMTTAVAEAEEWKKQVQEYVELKNRVAGKIENLLSRIEAIDLDRI